MKRKYELNKRAEAQADTRRRIVEAAIELHSTKGPARTTFSDVAQLAGVQRATLYSHFANEWELGMACSGLYSERNPAPDPEQWRGLQGEERLRRGLREMYAFFERNRAMFSHVMADMETHELTRAMFELRFGEQVAATRAVLAAALPSRRKAAGATLDLALSFATWQQLAACGLSSDAAADAMVRAVLAQ
ncbi:MAG TPA: TetR family transcriptional regulator [Thermoleophilaceae bacterium]